MKNFNDFINEKILDQHLLQQKFPCTFTIMTDKENVKSIKMDGYHFLVDSDGELEKLENKYKKGDTYNKEIIVSTSIHDENFGQF